MSETPSYRVTAIWVEGLQFVAHADRTGTTIALDTSPTAPGTGGGTSPMEMVLLGVAGCTGMDVISILQKKRQQVTAFHLNITGLRATEHPKSYTRIEVEYVVRGHAIAPEAVARAIELSQTKYCSVMGSLKAEIITSFRIEPAQDTVPA
ncbi:MAG: OsmC family protein [Anaerolineae bacterium]